MTTETVIWMVDGQSESGLDSIRNSCDVLNWLWRFEARGYDSEFTEYVSLQSAEEPVAGIAAANS